MRDLLDQTLQASDAGLYFLALSGALIIPSLANALEHETGGDQGGAAYGEWYDAWVRRPDDFADGEAIYRLRCSLLHQRRGAHPKSAFDRILFLEVDGIHNNLMNRSLQLSVPTFCAAMVAGARAWLTHVEGSEAFQHHLSQGLRRHPEGLAPYVLGLAVIA